MRGMVDRVFPERSDQRVTLRQALIAIPFVAAAVVASLTRTGGAGALNSTWIEDAKRFLSSALTKPFPGTVFRPFNGYFHVGPRLLTGLAVLFPVRWAAPVLTLLAVAMLAAFAGVVYVASGAFLDRWWQRLLVAAPVMMVPVGHSQSDNDVATLQFPSLYALFWLLLWRPASRLGKVAAVLLAAYVTFSSILALILLPLLVLRLFAVRDWTTRAIAFGYACGAGTQVFGEVSGVTTRDNIGHPRFDVLWVLGQYAVRAVPSSLLGEAWLGGPGVNADGVPVPLHIPNLAVHVTLIVAAWLVVAGALALALRHLTAPHWPLAVLAGAASLLIFGAEVAVMGSVQPRYLIAPALLIYTALVALLRPRPGLRLRPAAAPVAVLAVLLAVASAANWRVDNSRARSQAWSVTVRQGREACAMRHITVYRYTYSWWFVDIPCDRIQ